MPTWNREKYGTMRRALFMSLGLFVGALLSCMGKEDATRKFVDFEFADDVLNAALSRKVMEGALDEKTALSIYAMWIEGLGIEVEDTLCGCGNLDLGVEKQLTKDGITHTKKWCDTANTAD
jgi:hypothetical protein